METEKDGGTLCVPTSLLTPLIVPGVRNTMNGAKGEALVAEVPT